MRNSLTLFIATLALLLIYSCSQSGRKGNVSNYIVDEKIKEVVEKKPLNSNSKSISSVDFKMYANDSLIADTYAREKSIDDCILETTSSDHSVNIIGFMGMFGGFGYELTIFKDSFIVRHVVSSDAEIYKLRQTDSLTFGISVPCKSFKLTLANKPSFKKGEIVEGVIELTSDEYYEVSNGRERKYQMQLTGYFKTEPFQDE